MDWQHLIFISNRVGSAHRYSGLVRAINNLDQVVGRSGSHAVLWTTMPSLPQEEIELIIDDVDDMVSAAAQNNSQGTSLTSKLDVAIKQLNRDNVKAATNRLGAFVNQVSALMKAGILSTGEGQPLIDSANDIISDLTG